MLDLSITKNPVWTKTREELWKPIGKSLSEGLTKKELEKIHHYFMTGTLREGEEISDGAKFYWFPIQNPEAWNYIFEHLFNSKKAEAEFEKIFYFQFGEMAGRALGEEQELAMWDYFAGEKFQSIITSRVPIGKQKEIVSFRVDYGNVAAEFTLFMDRWNSGSCDKESKWKKRINYFLTFVESMSNESFVFRDDGKISTREGRCIKRVFDAVCHPIYGDEEHVLLGDELEFRAEFVGHLRETFNSMRMPSNMRLVWDEINKTS